MKKIVRLRAHHGMCLAFFEGKEYHKSRQKRENLRRLQLDRNLYQKRKRRAVKKNSFMKYQVLVWVHEAVLFIPILCRSPDRYRSRHRSFQAASGSFHRGSFLPHQEKEDSYKELLHQRSDWYEKVR